MCMGFYYVLTCCNQIIGCLHLSAIQRVHVFPWDWIWHTQLIDTILGLTFESWHNLEGLCDHLIRKINQAHLNILWWIQGSKNPKNQNRGNLRLWENFKENKLQLGLQFTPILELEIMTNSVNCTCLTLTWWDNFQSSPIVKKHLWTWKSLQYRY